jgi:hypothetical protein
VLLEKEKKRPGDEQSERCVHHSAITHPGPLHSLQSNKSSPPLLELSEAKYEFLASILDKQGHFGVLSPQTFFLDKGIS